MHPKVLCTKLLHFHATYDASTRMAMQKEPALPPKTFAGRTWEPSVRDHRPRWRLPSYIHRWSSKTMGVISEWTSREDVASKSTSTATVRRRWEKSDSGWLEKGRQIADRHRKRDTRENWIAVILVSYKIYDVQNCLMAYSTMKRRRDENNTK